MCVSMHVCVVMCVCVIGEGTNARISFRFIDPTHLSPGPRCNIYINIYIGADECVCSCADGLSRVQDPDINLPSPPTLAI